MSYVVLARKYRPQDFNALVGQHSVSQTLGNALVSGRIAHAYIFSGPRGVGKTTTARILAKCLNCEKGTSLTPCHQCASCIAISQGTSMQDVLEIDGASNRGIEQIRDLRDNAKYAPTSSRYRIFIIDEAHQITKDAFGALLKTLEEPPAHVVFMMATTEVQKIPAPILSRCQRFSLRPISPELVFQYLKEICAKEKIIVDDAALADIVRFVEGSLRDALSLLDQAIVYSPNGITSQTFRELLGLLPKELVASFAKTISQSDPVSILQAINSVVQQGTDLTQLAKDLEEYYHQLLLAKAGVKDPLNQSQEPLIDLSKNYDFVTLERSIRILARALIDMRNSDTPKAVFELAALKLGQKLLDPRAILERLEKLGSLSQSDRRVLTTEPARQPTPSFTKESLTPKAPSQNIGGPQIQTITEHKEPSVDNNPSAQDTSTFDLSAWPLVIHDIGQQKFSLGNALEDAKAELINNNLVLTFSKTFHQQTVARLLDFVTEALKKTWGTCPPVQLRVSEVSASIKKIEPRPPSTPFISGPEENQPAEELELEEIDPEKTSSEVKDFLKQFPGAIKRIKKGS